MVFHRFPWYFKAPPLVSTTGRSHPSHCRRLRRARRRRGAVLGRPGGGGRRPLRLGAVARRAADPGGGTERSFVGWGIYMGVSINGGIQNGWCRKGKWPIKMDFSGWWFGCHQFYFSIYWECHHPNSRTPSFFRGVALAHQPGLHLPEGLTMSNTLDHPEWSLL